MFAHLGARSGSVWEESFPWIPHHPILSPGSISIHSTFYWPPTHFSTSKEVRPCCLPVPGRLPARGRLGGDSQGGPQLGVPGTEATHVSRRIFLSATTSPVNLFLALYTTPYVPSPIFSTFWKFSMKRQRVGSARPWSGGLGTLQKADPGSRGPRRGKQGPVSCPRVGMERSIPLALVNLANLKQCCRLPPSSRPPPEAPPLLPAFPWLRPQAFLLVNVRAGGRVQRSSPQMTPPQASLVLRGLDKFLSRWGG